MFYRPEEAIFGCLGTSASEEVIIKLVTSKCLHILLYGTEIMQPNKSNLKSSDFMVNCFLMKLFRTSNVYVIDECRTMFGEISLLPSVFITSRTKRFLTELELFSNSVLSIFS